MWKRLARRAGTNTRKSTTHTHTETRTRTHARRWEVSNFKLGLRKHVASDGSVCGNWLWKTETPGFSWQDVILIGSLEYKTSDERKSGTRHTRDDCLCCESGKMKRGGQVTRWLRKWETYRNQSHTFIKWVKPFCCCCFWSVQLIINTNMRRKQDVWLVRGGPRCQFVLTVRLLNLRAKLEAPVWDWKPRALVSFSWQDKIHFCKEANVALHPLAFFSLFPPSKYYKKKTCARN